MVSEGDRIRLIDTSDPYTKLSNGEEGTVDEITQMPAELNNPKMPKRKLWVNWDSGSRLALLEGVDKYEVINDDE
jgi:hypothetical protein